MNMIHDELMTAQKMDPPIFSIVCLSSVHGV